MQIQTAIRPGMELIHENNGVSDVYSIGNLKETVTLTGNGKKSISRVLWDGNQAVTSKSSVVSDEYLPLPALYNLGLIMKEPEFVTLYDQTEIIDLKPDGSLQFVYKDSNSIEDGNIPVLDVQQTVMKTDRKRGSFSLDEFQVTRSTMEKAVPMYMITNSFDRTKAVQIVAGLYRFVCTNGLVVPSRFGGEEFGDITKYKHYRSSQEDIEDAIVRGLKQIVKAGAKVEWAKKLYKMGFTDSTRKYLLDELSKLLETKRQNKTYQQYAPAIESTFEFFFQLIPRMENLLDFENVLSYMTAVPNGVKRFPTMVQNISREIEKTVLQALV